MSKNPLISTSAENKKHFAAALNSARHNLYTTLKHIGDVLKLDTSNDNEEQLIDCALMGALQANTLKNERLQSAINQLDKNMPFLKAMLDKEIDYAVYIAKKEFKENNPQLFNYNKSDKQAEKKANSALEKAADKAKMVTHKTYHTILTRIIRTLSAYRNEHTHYDPVDCWKKNALNDQKVIVRYMLNIFDGARRRVKERFEYTEADMEFLTGSEHFDKVDITDETTGEPKVNSNGYKEKKHVERIDFYYKLGNDDNTRLTATGLVMFTCLFINKQQSKILIDKVKLHRGRKGTTEKQKHIIFEIFCDYRIKLSRERIESTRPDYALALDMFNELQKCPIELFDVLSPDDQNLFRVTSQNTDGTDSAGENLMVRFQDRFPRLAMSYIDQIQALDDFRFQVSLGKYRFEFYDKKCIDSTDPDRVRALQKEINGFGRLNDIEAKRRVKYATLISDDNLTQVDTADTKPYITDQRAAYKITGNRIGMKIISDKSGLFIPDLNGRATQCLQPDCWLSIYELPALLFHHLLTHNDDAKATSTIIKTCIENYRRFFTDVKDGKLTPVANKDVFATIMQPYGIKPCDVPQELQDYLTGKKVDIDNKLDDRVYDSIEELIQQVKKQIDRFKDGLKMVGSKENKLGKKAHAEIKPGRLASELAKDIVKWQPAAPEAIVNGKKRPQGWNKLTGLNYAVMQSTLATFKGNLDEVKRVLVSAGISAGKYPHPFIAKVLAQNPSDVVELYRIYLDEKLKFLKKFDSYDDDMFNAIANVLTRYNRNRWDARTPQWYKSLAEKYLSAPIELPRSLFEDSIKKLVVENYTDFPELEATIGSERGCNIAHLIARFNEIIYQDSNQDFYYPEKGFKRTYKYFNLINNKKSRNQLQEIYLTIEEITSLNEKIKLENKEQRLIDSITHYRADIQAQKREEMKRGLARSKRDYTDNEKTIRRYKVQDILMFLMAKKLLSMTMQQFKQRYHLCDIRPNSERGILSTSFPFSVTLKFASGKEVTISQKELKVKNFGDFFRFIYDGRLESLLSHLDCNEIEREALEKEFENYDLTRPEIFGAIHQIEREIIEAHKIDKNDPIKINFRRLLSLKNGDATNLDEDSEIIIEIRNAFSHNRYPNDSLKQAITEVAKSYPEEVKKHKKS